MEDTSGYGAQMTSMVVKGRHITIGNRCGGEMITANGDNKSWTLNRILGIAILKGQTCN